MNTKQETNTLMEQAAQWMSRLGADDNPRWDDPALGTWLAQSSRHREAFAEVSAIWFAAEQIAPPVGTTGLRPERLSAPLPLVARKPRRWSLMAGAALAVVALLWLPAVPQQWAAMQAKHVTQRGESANITMSDGSTIDLAGNSAFSPADNGRGIKLHYGEVFLNVSHDPDNPFVVTTGGASVTVLGTQFGVAWRNNEHRAGVVSGRVAVNVENLPAIELGPGDMSLNGDLQIAGERDGDYFGWRSGNLVFEGVPLSQVLDRLSPFLTERVILVPGAGDPAMTAVVSLASGNQMLKTLADRAGLKLVSAGPVKLLY